MVPPGIGKAGSDHQGLIEGLVSSECFDDKRGGHVLLYVKLEDGSSLGPRERLCDSRYFKSCRPSCFGDELERSKVFRCSILSWTFTGGRTPDLFVVHQYQNAILRHSDV